MPLPPLRVRDGRDHVLGGAGDRDRCRLDGKGRTAMGELDTVEE